MANNMIKHGEVYIIFVKIKVKIKYHQIPVPSSHVKIWMYICPFMSQNYRFADDIT